MSQGAPLVLPIVDGLKVVVPDSMDLITPYVLREQQDWFEEEIRFVRRVLEPGQRAVDIGANYGLFTLSMAKVVGREGHVWAFEPASTTAAYLERSLDANGLPNVTLRKAGLSVRAGVAELSLNANAELNGITRGGEAGAAGGTTERIELCSLDELDAAGTWDSVDFLKVDAEGEELRIIEGAASFLRRHSPLIQFEVKAGSKAALEPMHAFWRHGYEPYRLVPGPGVLVPFDPREAVDMYLLNLFCCKRDRAAQLAERGLLVGARDLPPPPGPDVLAARNGDGRFTWPEALGQFPYARLLADEWRSGPRTNERAQVERALSLFALSRAAEVPIRDRVLALRRSVELLEKACTVPEFMRLASLARAARAFGARARTVQALGQLMSSAGQRGGLSFSEPFLAPCERFEGVDPGTRLNDWAVAAALEEFELAQAYSSYYSPSASLPRLKGIAALGFGSDEMARRLEMVQARLATMSES
jgi:protein O-GlcNAc transferase